MESLRLFSPDREGLLVSRPNRFVIMTESEGELLRCHCPNPGRMLELALPGTPLILEAGKEGRATAWTAAAARYMGAVVPLAPGRSNAVARDMLIPRLWPELRALRQEVAFGASRFDFAAEDEAGRGHYIEVKTCSLVEEGLALFPDAPSARAARHLEELSAAVRAGFACHVLFVVVHGHARSLSPNVHTDPAFARALVEARGAGVELRAAEIAVDESGLASPSFGEVPVDLDPVKLCDTGTGACLAVFSLERKRSLDPGGSGSAILEAGCYAWAGELDPGFRRAFPPGSLPLAPGSLKVFPILGGRGLEGELVEGLEAIGGRPIPGFPEREGGEGGRGGSLFGFPEDPLGSKAFVGLLMRLRHSRAFAEN